MAQTSVNTTLSAISTTLAPTVPLTPQEAFSGIFGSISLCAWIFVLVPQLYENYASHSASGISLLFLIVWLAGDVTNLLGSIWAQLVPTVTALAVYFCFADAILITQVLWYEYWPTSWRRTPKAVEEEEDDEEPLLGRRESNSSIGLPGSHMRKRRRSSVASRTSQTNHGASGSFGHGERTGSLPQIPEDLVEESSGKRAWLINTGAIMAICVLGTVGWVICWKTGLWTPAAVPRGGSGDSAGGSGESAPLGALILGYLSAVAYLGARIPQILKNWRDRSTEGLSLLFFMLSMLGNITYGAGILFHSLDRDYVMKNLPWLIGSLGTIVEDLTIFLQFQMYGGEGSSQTQEGAEEAIQ